MAKKRKTPPVVHLSFSKGDLIIKEGDYGISIYKILKGHVLIFKKTADTKTSLAELGRGEVFGEMTFFNFLYEPRSASVEALDEVELEVWHPARLTEEYRAMPPILKYMSNQVLNRLLKMNRVVDELTKRQRQRRAEAEKAEPLGKRRYFRKKCTLKCRYHLAGSESRDYLLGVIADISPLGVGLEVAASNRRIGNHNPGSELELTFQLPPDTKITERGKVQLVTASKTPNHLLLGVEFENLSHYSKRMIGFFMMK